MFALAANFSHRHLAFLTLFRFQVRRYDVQRASSLCFKEEASHDRMEFTFYLGITKRKTSVERFDLEQDLHQLRSFIY